MEYKSDKNYLKKPMVIRRTSPGVPSAGLLEADLWPLLLGHSIQVSSHLPTPVLQGQRNHFLGMTHHLVVVPLEA